MHIKQSVGPVAFDVPAGALCDFAYHEEDVGIQNTTRFFDDQGNLIGVEDQIAVSILHRNAATGQTLTEDLHYAAHVDVSGGQVRVAGQTWHLRAEDGRLVLSGAGLIATDLLIGMAGGYAISGRGPRWFRILLGVTALVPIPGWAIASSAFGPAFALTTPRGAWVALFFYSLIATLDLACAIPHRPVAPAVLDPNPTRPPAATCSEFAPKSSRKRPGSRSDDDRMDQPSPMPAAATLTSVIAAVWRGGR